MRDDGHGAQPAPSEPFATRATDILRRGKDIGQVEGFQYSHRRREKVRPETCPFALSQDDRPNEAIPENRGPRHHMGCLSSVLVFSSPPAA